MKPTTLEMEIELMNHFDFRRNVIVPNVSDWSGLLRFEADILSLTKSGFATVTEIKISKSDLKADLKKRHIQLIDDKLFFFEKIKYFYYAVPKFLEEDALNQIPEFSGLLVLDHRETFVGSKIFVKFFKEIRKPKTINRYKWSDKERNKLMRLGCMRIKTLKQNIDTLKVNLKDGQKTSC